jgi:ADP-heptose:LPS heptosyltransferase
MNKSKIIYFKPWGGLGDVLLATPALSAIKTRYPEALIYCQDIPFHRQLLEPNPNIHGFVSSAYGILHTPEDQLKTITNHFQGQEVIFYPCYGYLYPSLLNKPEHAIDIICKMAGLYPAEARVLVYLAPEDMRQAQIINGQIGQPWIALHAQSVCSKNKEWYPERWSNVIAWLNLKGYKVVQLGCEGETYIEGAINLLGKTTIRQALALIKQAQYFLGIDSVFNHAAHSFGIRGVVLFGASTPLVWGYKENINLYSGLRCQPCIDLLKDRCQPRRCMQRITVDEVIRALESMILESMIV